MLFDETIAQHGTGTSYYKTGTFWICCSTLSSSLEFNFSNTCMSAFISILFCFASTTVAAATSTVAIVIIDVVADADDDDDARK